MSKRIQPIKCYTRHDTIPLEEGLQHEFKGHRLLAEWDVSPLKNAISRNFQLTPKVKRYNKPISPYICGMLNTGKGGTMFLGVTDEGRIEGLMMSVYQKDHFKLALKDLLDSYSPPVPEHFYEVDFVPVVDEDETAYRPDPTGPTQNRNLHHELQASRYCWCDCFTFAAHSMGILHRFYVIELRIKAWDPTEPRNAQFVEDGYPMFHPIFDDEEGQFYIRRNATTVKCNLEQMLDWIRSQAALSRNGRRDSGVGLSPVRSPR